MEKSKRDDLHRRAINGEPVAAHEVFALLEALDQAEAWGDALMVGWKKDSERMAGEIGGMMRLQRYARPRDGRSNPRKAPSRRASKR